MDALSWARFQFGFTITFHYLFPQLTMGLALIIVLFKAMALRAASRDVELSQRYNGAARFWARIFGINFALGVVTGIPMEFQFGTNWARFSAFTGGVIGLTLAMEGMFAFFAESAFLGAFLFGEKRLGPKGHMFASMMVFLGSWLSGYFIIVTDAFMQHPVGFSQGANKVLQLSDFWAYLFNPWALWQYAHNMSASVITAAFVVTAVGAFWALQDIHREHARLFLRVGVVVGFVFCVLQLFPTGDGHGKMVAKHQPVALAAMEGKFNSSDQADMVLIGQPDVGNRRLDNAIAVPKVLSFLAYGSFGAVVRGLNDFPQDQWPDNIELLYFAYHIMVGLGTIFMALTGLSLLMLRKDRVLQSRPLLWILMLAFPFPYIATTAGWMAAELGRQPWIVYGLQRTSEGTSPLVSGGSIVFTALGFMGMYLVIGLLFLYMVMKQIAAGPQPHEASA
jgi:cytochrome d ubiquinol oxidase subunit I